jgi:hypothetical protein
MLQRGEAAVAPKTPSREGYTFKSWDKDFSEIKSDLTVTAVYQQNLYTVTFLDWDGTVIIRTDVTFGEKVIAPESPSRPGYDFIAWDTDLTKITTDLTVTALYEIAQYTVIFKDWDGTVIGSDDVSFENAAVAPDAPVRTGHVFVGWDKAFDKVMNNLTVTALYQADKFTVTFRDFDDTIINSQEVEYGKPAKAPKNPSRLGYDFISWDKGFAYITETINVTANYMMISDTYYIIDEPGIYQGEEFANFGNIIIRAEGVILKGGNLMSSIYVEAENVHLSELSIGGSVFLTAAYIKISDSVINGTLAASSSSIVLENLNISGDVSIGATDISLLGGWIGGNLTIEKTVADGHVIITGIIARDTILYVRGGGSNSIIITDSEISAIIVDKLEDAGKEIVRVAVQGNSIVANAIINSNAIIDNTAKGDGIKQVIIDNSEDSSVELRGKYQNVKIETTSTLINNATIQNLNVERNAENVVVKGSGTIENLINLTSEGKGPIFNPKQSDNDQPSPKQETEIAVPSDAIEKMEIKSPKTGGNKVGGYIWLLICSAAISSLLFRKRKC